MEINLLYADNFVLVHFGSLNKQVKQWMKLVFVQVNLDSIKLKYVIYYDFSPDTTPFKYCSASLVYLALDAE